MGCLVGIPQATADEAAYLPCHGVLDDITGAWMRSSHDGDGRLSRPSENPAGHNGHFARAGSPAQRLSDVDVVGATSTSLNLAMPSKRPRLRRDSRGLSA